MFDLESHTLEVDGEPVRLTATETKIVELLMRSPDAFSRRRRFNERVWGETAFGVEKYGHGAHPAHPGKDRDKPEGA